MSILPHIQPLILQTSTTAGEIDEANKNFDEEASFEAEIKFVFSNCSFLQVDILMMLFLFLSSMIGRPFDSLSEHGSSHADDNAFQGEFILFLILLLLLLLFLLHDQNRLHAV